MPNSLHISPIQPRSHLKKQITRSPFTSRDSSSYVSSDLLLQIPSFSKEVETDRTRPRTARSKINVEVGECRTPEIVEGPENPINTSCYVEDASVILIQKLQPQAIKLIFRSKKHTKSLSPRKRPIEYYSSRKITYKREEIAHDPIVIGNKVNQYKSAKAITDRKLIKVRKKTSRSFVTVDLFN